MGEPGKSVTIRGQAGADGTGVSIERITADHVNLQLQGDSLAKLLQTVKGKSGRSLPPYNLNFTGREAKLDEIVENFNQGSAVTITQTIHGLGGVGKSQLALRYAYTFASEKPEAAVWWFGAQKPDELEGTVQRFLASVGFEKFPDETVSEALQRWGNNNSDWLLVFDNVEEYDDVQKYLPSGAMQGYVLLTTRKKSGFPNWVDLSVYLDQEAKDYLEKRLGGKYNEADAEKLMIRLGNFPLALSQAAAYMVNSNWPIAQYLDEIEKLGDELPPVDKDSKEYFQQIIWQTWTTTIQKISESSPEANRLLQILSYFSADGLPVQSYDNTPVARMFRNRTAFTDAGRKLREYAMIDDNNSIHRLLQEVVRHEDKEKHGQSAHAEALGYLVDALYRAYEEDKKTKGTAFITLAPHVISACSYVDSEVPWTLKFDQLRDQKKFANDDERFKWLLLTTSAELEKMLDMRRDAYSKLMGERMLRKPDGSIWRFGGFEWEVLRERSYKGQRQALIVTRQPVEQRAYDQVTYEEWKSAKYSGVTWENSSMRAYLNNLPTSREYYVLAEEEPYAVKETIPAGAFVEGGFLRHFNAEERAQIFTPNRREDPPLPNPDTTYVSRNGTKISTPGGEPTWDSVFLLSHEDIGVEDLPTWETKPDWYRDYKKDWDKWLEEKTPYSRDLIATGMDQTFWWWLRSPGAFPNSAAYVNYAGNVYLNGSLTFRAAGSVRPALWLNLKS